MNGGKYLAASDDKHYFSLSASLGIGHIVEKVVQILKTIIVHNENVRFVEAKLHFFIVARAFYCKNTSPPLNNNTIIQILIQPPPPIHILSSFFGIHEHMLLCEVPCQ